MTAYRDKRTKLYRYNFQVAMLRYTRRGFATKREAQAAEAEHRRRVLLGLSGTWPTTAELAKEYLAERCRRGISQEWVDQCFWKLTKHAAPLMQMPPKEVRPLHVQRLLTKLATVNGARSVNEIRTILHSLFQWATDMEAIDRNPVKRIPKMHVPAEPIDPIPTDDLRKLIVAAVPRLRALLIVQAVTGARWREIAGLRPDDLELDATPPAILLRTRKTGGAGERIRRAHLPPMAVDALRLQLQAASEEWVFHGRYRSKRLGYDPMKRELDEACDRAEIPRYGFHAVRRWAGTTAMEGGASNTVVSRFLGHTKTTVTDLYMRVADPLMAEVSERLAKKLG